MGDRIKIIVGVDYGTTFTGVSYTTSDKASVDDIVVVKTWPGPGAPVEGNWKTPTVIAYGSENGQDRNSWGYQVVPNMKSCSWTKLLLDTSAETAEYDDPSLREAAGSSLLRLPPGKDAQTACQDFLKEIYDFLVRSLKAKMGAEVFHITPMECYLTMPAIWTDKAQAATRNAAIGAGFGSRSFDTIRMITEPEAAAIATLKRDLRPNSINAAKPGDNILILDCGGGTVDITTYTITRTYPQIGFEEICAGAGGKCGSTYIDRNFHKLMVERFGSSFQNVLPKRKAPGSKLMRSFEKAKQSFGSFESDEFLIESPVMDGVNRPEYYDEEESTIKLSKADMVRLFDPVMKEIRRLVEDQVEKARRQKSKNISLIVLVGGFGNSDYLKMEIDNWCRSRGIKCIRPDFCQAAVVRGAAIRGLEGTMPSKLICRRHYGFTWGEVFRPGIDKEENAFYIFGTKFCRGFIKWMMTKGSEITATTSSLVDVQRAWSPGESYVFTDTLYTCNLDSAPNRIEGPRVVYAGTISMDFTGVGMSLFEKRPTSSGMEYKLEYQLKIEFRSQDGVLKYSSVVNGRTIGTTTIDFNE
ncbi:hypothetical protein H072_6309 [Dactylellina haptotyla CBS 200.50]|uniref:Uncharacterized protein n=1 Tax=Dactylellina haptotyla (strain CBS 200.50) TaxID=1284197 RepID=S8AAH7_DACHA|nr:hypothetical protein H072_6309 [Dactylellina haptotyla CBS 200.50]